jgi:hypothetical protein
LHSLDQPGFFTIENGTSQQGVKRLTVMTINKFGTAICQCGSEIAVFIQFRHHLLHKFSKNQILKLSEIQEGQVFRMVKILGRRFDLIHSLSSTFELFQCFIVTGRPLNARKVPNVADREQAKSNRKMCVMGRGSAFAQVGNGDPNLPTLPTNRNLNSFDSNMQTTFRESSQLSVNLPKI